MGLKYEKFYKELNTTAMKLPRGRLIQTIWLVTDVLLRTSCFILVVPVIPLRLPACVKALPD